MTRKMKDSGIAWIGEIPEEWELIKAKYIFKQRNTRGNSINLEQLSPTQKYGVIPQKLYDELSGMNAVKLNDKVDLMSLKTIHKGDFCISLRSFEGGFEYSDYEGVVSPAYQVFYNTIEVSLDYYKFMFKDESFIQKMNSFTMSLRDGKNISFRDFGNTYIPYPPLKEQNNIAEFLNYKNDGINKLINITNQEIQKLEAYKKALITEVVTKGLDKDVPMKDSGIEWIGEIPEHWKVGKTLYYLEMPITDGPHITPTLYDDGVPFVSAEAVSTGNGRINFDNIRGYVSEEFYLECCKKYVPQIDDIYMIKSGATTGRLAIVGTDEKFTIWSPLAVFRANKEKINTKFLYYALQSNYYLTQVELFWNYGTQQNIGMRTLEKLMICIPDITEQSQIVTYLDKKCTTIDRTLDLKRRQVDVLEDYKKSLIYECVTGKKEVVG